MEQDRKEKLQRVTNDVLERFAFTFAEEPEEGEGAWPGEYIHASISFSGRNDGVLVLVVPEPLSRELAGNIMGEDPDKVGDDMRDDAVKEMINIICGELVAELYDDTDVYDLSVPALCRIDKTKWCELSAETDSVVMSAEEQQMLVCLTAA